MGRLRDDFENPLFQGAAEEVVELFGMSDVVLYRHTAVDQTGITDPLWNEPTTTIRYAEFKIQAMFMDWQEDMEVTEAGQHQEFRNRIYVAVNHLLKALVPRDANNELVAEGDVIKIHSRGEWREYDIIQVSRTGWINDTDKFTGYELDVVRRDKYTPDRKTGS